MTDSPLTYKIAFSSLRGINVATGRRLLGTVGSPENFFRLSDSELAASTGLDRALTDSAYRRRLLDSASTETTFVDTNHIRTMFFDDSAYPARLGECDDAPAMLYSVGDCNLDARHVVAIVGTRRATTYGIRFTSELVASLAEKLDGLLIVSGLAYGIDIAAHRAALDAGIPTVAVVAHGLNTIYPAEHRMTARKMVADGGAIVSEYRSDSATHPGNFLARNRIVAGLSDCVIIVESDLRGGAMTTARLGAAYNREVMAVPGRTTDRYSRGCNRLIADQTARIITSADDLIAAMGWRERQPEGTQQTLTLELDPESTRVVGFIASSPGATVNDICAALAIPYSRLSALLFDLEMSDTVTALPGGRYEIMKQI